jgi:hypothetical protein
LPGVAASNHGAAEQPQLTQQIVDSSISKDSDSGSADAPTSKPAASVLKQLVLATPKESSYSLYGSHAADGTVFTLQQLQEWPVQDCKDYVVGGVVRSWCIQDLLCFWRCLKAAENELLYVHTCSQLVLWYPVLASFSLVPRVCSVPSPCSLSAGSIPLAKAHHLQMAATCASLPVLFAACAQLHALTQQGSVACRCVVLQDRCPAWAADGECSRNVDYMAISCKASCKNCKLYSTRQPFRVVQLNSGYAMPAVGFGTAGLGIGTAAAVQYAVSAGYRMIDTAEVRHLRCRAAVGTAHML